MITSPHRVKYIIDFVLILFPAQVIVGSKLRPERHAAHLVRGAPTDGVAPKVGEPAHRGASKPQVSLGFRV
jgi:hypothetical protein